MDWKKGVLDVSYNYSDLLLEDTADSHDQTEAVPDLKTHAAEVAIAGDDDDLQDAESCSCDSASDYNKLGFSKVVDSDDKYSDGGSNFGNIDGDDDHCEKSVGSCCETRSVSDVALECRSFSKEEEKKIGEFNNSDEMDQDRLFWETCMAEGYP